MVNRRTAQALIVLTLAAFAARAVVAEIVQRRVDADPHRDFLIEGDANGYWELGLRLASGQPYAVHDPPRRVMRMPGFPLFLAACIRMFGPDHRAARMMNCAVGSMACALVFGLGCCTVGRTVAWRAAVCTAFSPTLVGMSALLLSETLFAVSVLLSLCSLVALTHAVTGRALRGAWLDSIECPDRGKTARAAGHEDRTTGEVRAAAREVCPAASGGRVAAWGVVAGACGAVATYVRPSWLLFPLICAGWLMIRTRCGWRSLVAGACVAMGLFGSLLPWAIRNRSEDVAGRWVWTTLWVGPSLYDGLNPHATGASDMSFVDRDGVYRRMSEFEADRYYRTEAWRFVREHPGKAVALAFAKWKRFFSPWPLSASFDAVAVRLVMLVYWLMLVVGGATGVWRMRRQPDALLLLAGPMAYLAAVHGVFVGSMRYRVPVEPPWVIVACAGLSGSCGGVLRRLWWRHSQAV